MNAKGEGEGGYTGVYSKGKEVCMHNMIQKQQKQ